MKKHNAVSTALLLCAILFCLIPGTAVAEYWGMVDAPDWEGSEGYTRQSWGFNTEPLWHGADLDGDGDSDAYLGEESGYSADVDIQNAYGGAFFIRSDFGDAYAWDWMDQGPMNQDWNGLQGMIGGMGSGALDFRVHAQGPSGRDKQIWIQYVVYIANGSDASAMDTVISSTHDFATRQGTIVDKQWDRIAQLDDRGAGGQWWRVTELWRIGMPGPVDYVRIRTAPGAVNIIDSVDIITRTLGFVQGEDKKGEDQ